MRNKQGETHSNFNVDRLFEIALKLENQNGTLEESLAENSMSFLLAEELDKKDIEELRSATVAVAKSVDTIQKAIADKLPSVSTYLDGLSTNIEKAQKFTAELDMDSPDGIVGAVKKFFGGKIDAKTALQSVLQLQAKAKQVTDTLEGALGLLIKNIGGLIKDEAQKDSPLRDIAGTDPIPDEAKMKQAVAKALKGSQPGMIGKLVNFLKGSTAKSDLLQGIGDLDGNLLADDIMGLSLNDLQALNDAMAAAPDVETPSQSTTQDIATADQPEGGGEQEEPAGEATPEEEAEAEGAADAAAEEASSKRAPPGEGAEYIVTQWADAGKTLSRNVSKKQRANLSKSLGGVFKTASDKLGADVTAAIDSWRGAQKVLQSPNVSDKQIDALKANLSDFVSGIIAAESRDPMRAVRSAHTKMSRYLIENGAYSKDVILEWNHKKLISEFVHTYCSIEIYTLEPTGLLQEHLIDPYEDTAYDEDELIQSHWLRMAGLGDK